MPVESIRLRLIGGTQARIPRRRLRPPDLDWDPFPWDERSLNRHASASKGFPEGEGRELTGLAGCAASQA
jgi:hypothetical protein